MKKRFKSKKRSNKKIYLYLLITIISFSLSLSLLSNNKDIMINSFLSNITNKTKEKITNTLLRLNAPENIIYASLNKNVNKKKLSVFSEVEDNYNYEDSNTDYVEDPEPKKINEPIIYLYNTHQLEEYSSKITNDYNVKPNVLIASYMLKEKLNNKDLPTIVETANMKKYINKNKLKYKNSYKASRYFLTKTKNNNKSIKYYIDIHRDSIKYKNSTIKYKGKKYARVMFIIGMEHKNYKKNLIVSKDINKILEYKIPGISRGINKKRGRKVNGIYNQDISEYVIVIEIGGIENEIEEVDNTLDILSECLSIYIGDNNGKTKNEL